MYSSLTTVGLQADREFVDILSAVRSGRCGASVLGKLKAHCGRPLGEVDSILATKVGLHYK